MHAWLHGTANLYTYMLYNNCKYKKHFKEMHEHVGMTMVKKGQRQDYFSQQSILLTLPAYIKCACCRTLLFISLKCF